jgi:hypothetical protein
MCRLSRNLGASTFWNPKGLSRPVMGLLYLSTWRSGNTLYSILEVPGTNLEQVCLLRDFFVRFPLSLQANAEIVPRLRHDRFLPDPFQFIIIHWSSCNRRCVVQDTDTIVENAQITYVARLKFCSLYLRLAGGIISWYIDVMIRLCACCPPIEAFVYVNLLDAVTDHCHQHACNSHGREY